MARAPADAVEMVTPEKMSERYDRAEAAIAELRERVRAGERLDEARARFRYHQLQTRTD